MMVVIAAKIPSYQTATSIVSSAIVKMLANAKIYGKRKNALKRRRTTNAGRKGYGKNAKRPAVNATLSYYYHVSDHVFQYFRITFVTVWFIF